MAATSEFASRSVQLALLRMCGTVRNRVGTNAHSLFRSTVRLLTGAGARFGTRNTTNTNHTAAAIAASKSCLLQAAGTSSNSSVHPLVRLELPTQAAASQEARIVATPVEEIQLCIGGVMSAVKKLYPKATAADMAEIETCTIAVVGKAREGKSTLMDQVIETMNGEATTTTSGDVLQVIAGPGMKEYEVVFKRQGGDTACTKGADVTWLLLRRTPAATGAASGCGYGQQDVWEVMRGFVLVGLVDVQGLHDSATGAHGDMLLLGSVLQLCNHVMHNVKGTVQEAEMATLVEGLQHQQRMNDNKSKLAQARVQGCSGEDARTAIRCMGQQYTLSNFTMVIRDSAGVSGAGPLYKKKLRTLQTEALEKSNAITAMLLQGQSSASTTAESHSRRVVLSQRVQHVQAAHMLTPPDADDADWDGSLDELTDSPKGKAYGECVRRLVCNALADIGSADSRQHTLRGFLSALGSIEQDAAISAQESADIRKACISPDVTSQYAAAVQYRLDRVVLTSLAAGKLPGEDEAQVSLDEWCRTCKQAHSNLLEDAASMQGKLLAVVGLNDAAMLTLSASAHGLLKLLFNALLPDALEVSFEVFLMDVVQHAADGTKWTDELMMEKRLVFAEHSRIALGTVPDLAVGPEDTAPDKVVELWCDKPAGHALEEKYFGSSVDAVELQAKRDRVRAEQEAQRRQRAQREAEAEAARKAKPKGSCILV